MENHELLQKQKKARAYANQPELFEVLAIQLQMRSQHGIRQITYTNGDWKCTCDFFLKRGTCSHTMAVGQMLATLSITQPAGSEQEKGNGSEQGGSEESDR